MSKHAIRLPGTLLDELKSENYENDERFNCVSKQQKFKKNISRKELRRLNKQKAKEKRQNTRGNQKKIYNRDHISSESKRSIDSVILSPKKRQKLKNFQSKELNSSSIGSETDDSMDDLSKLKSKDNSNTDKMFDNSIMTADETIAKLKALKGKKLLRNKIPTLKTESKDTEAHITHSDHNIMEKDEMDILYYAKKLGLGKKKKISADNEYDAVGGLLEGLDFFENFEENINSTANYLPEEYEKDQSSGESDDEIIENPFSSDDELSSSDFDDSGDDDSDDDDSVKNFSQEELLDNNSKVCTQKKNPYVAPSSDHSVYVPPRLNKHQLEISESDTIHEVEKKVKSLLNKLSESNITVIISSLNDLYGIYPRHSVTDALITQIDEIMCQTNKLLDSFIMNYAGVAFALWKLQGVEMAGSFIKRIVLTFVKLFENQMSLTQQLGTSDNTKLSGSKDCSNILSLLSYCYNFGMTSSRIIYDLIRILICSPNEFTTELLLKIIAVSGLLIRSDDPAALKSIMFDLLDNVKSITQTSRMKFLLETISDLKNNRLKPSILSPSHQALKKNLVRSLKLSVTESSEPLQVSLDDIKNAGTKGEWWLVGASWKGNMNNILENTTSGQEKVSSSLTSKIIVDDSLLNDIPDWSEIAKKQRMNTGVRKAIFISIISAQDYMDAFTKLEKLNLKSKQYIEVPKILLHCLSQDKSANVYNLYYPLLGVKISQNNHNISKSFQFLFWNLIKKFEVDYISNDEDNILDEYDNTLSEDDRLRQLSNQARFFGYLMAESIMKLDAFKHVPIMTGLTPDGMFFIEMLLFQMFLTIAKRSEVKTRSQGKKIIKFKDEELFNFLKNNINPDNKSVILKSLKWFINDKSKLINCITFQKGSKQFEHESRRLNWAVPTFLRLITNEISHIKG